MEHAVNWLIDALGALGPLGIAGLAMALMTALLFLRGAESRSPGPHMSRSFPVILPRPDNRT